MSNSHQQRIYLSDSNFLESDINSVASGIMNDRKKTDDLYFLYTGEKQPLIQNKPQTLFSPTNNKPWWAEDDNDDDNSVATKDLSVRLPLCRLWFSLIILHFCAMFVFDTLSNPPWISSYGIFLNPLVGPGETTLMRFGMVSLSPTARILTNTLVCAHLPHFMTIALSVKMLMSEEKTWCPSRLLLMFLTATLLQIIPSLVIPSSVSIGAGGSIFPLTILSAQGVKYYFSQEKVWSGIGLVVIMSVGMGVSSCMSVWIQLCGVITGLVYGIYWFGRQDDKHQAYMSPILGLKYQHSKTSKLRLKPVALLFVLMIASTVLSLLGNGDECTIRHVVLGQECLQSCLFLKRLENGSCVDAGFEYLSRMGRDVDVYSVAEPDNISYFGVGQLAVEDAY